jgi:CRISPR/Cas system Type II protein with McrA/HNH and RuvC-like nuclease domain
MDCYIYISFMTLQTLDTDMGNLFKHNNSKHNITGIMVYNKGNVIQIFEGPIRETQQLHQNISQDSRHKNMLTLMHTLITKRNFPEWSMEIILTDKFKFDTLKQIISSNKLHLNNKIQKLFDSYLYTNRISSY